MKHIDTMTARELRIEIAERLGYRNLIEAVGNDRVVGMAAEEGPTDFIPDWPNDTGTALALCLEIGKQHKYQIAMRQAWPHQFSYDDDEHQFTVSFVYFIGRGRINEDRSHTVLPDTVNWVHTASDDTPSLALSRLALKVLREPQKQDS